MKKRNIMAAALAAVMLVASGASPVMAQESNMKVSLGADLTDDQRAEVFSLLEITEEDLNENEVVYVTNEEEHEYLDSYIDAEKIGDSALSSSKVILREEGYGINVTTYNINYCTTGMYKNALLTAGVENADVFIAGPEKISGTAALIGIMKAYNEATSGSLDSENIEAAAQEIAVTSEIAGAMLNSENAEKIVSELKTQLDKIAGEDDAAIDERIRDVAGKYGEELSDENVAAIRELLKTLSGLDLNGLLQKARELYESFTEFTEGAGGIQGILNSIGEFFNNIFSTISDWISGLS